MLKLEPFGFTSNVVSNFFITGMNAFSAQWLLSNEFDIIFKKTRINLYKLKIFH